jgi:6-phosphogluconate dehydrogenase
MQLGFVGLGKMGSNMVLRLLRGKHQVVVYDTREDVAEILVSQGASGAKNLAQIVKQLKTPRVVWVMVPAGDVTESVINSLSGLLSKGDTVIDGGNSFYKDSVRRAAIFKSKGIYFLDAGTSGGIWGLTEGYCLMVGGERETFKRLEPIFQTLAPAPDKGYGYMGPSGAGHFVKMVHNGIEYGLMEAYAEGFELLNAKQDFKLNLPQIAEMWNHGSVVRSWLLELAASALKDDPGLENLEAYVEDSGEGRWTVHEAIDLAVPVPVISDALQARFRSRQPQPFGARLLAALRNQFGGHEVHKAK